MTPSLVAEDEIQFQTWNRYAYVGNNPLSNVDPLGLDAQCSTDASGNTTCTSNVTAYPSWWAFVYEGGPFSSWSNMVCMLLGGCYSTPPQNSGGSGGRQPQPQPKPNPSPVTVVRNVIHNVACAAVSPLLLSASATGWTVGTGVGGSAGIGVGVGASVSGGFSILTDPRGNVGLSFSGGGNPGPVGVLGAGAQIGRQFSVSNASTIFDTKGPALSVSGSYLALGLNLSSSPDGSVQTLTGTVGPGVGGRVYDSEAGGSAIPFSFNCSDVVH